MSLAPNAQMTFVDYTIEDLGIRLHFVCANPGPGQLSDYRVLLTDADINSVTTQLDLKNLVTTKMQRAFRASTLTAKLDPLIGQSITI